MNKKPFPYSNVHYLPLRRRSAAPRADREVQVTSGLGKHLNADLFGLKSQKLGRVPWETWPVDQCFTGRLLESRAIWAQKPMTNMPIWPKAARPGHPEDVWVIRFHSQSGKFPRFTLRRDLCDRTSCKAIGPCAWRAVTARSKLRGFLSICFCQICTYGPGSVGGAGKSIGWSRDYFLPRQGSNPGLPPWRLESSYSGHWALVPCQWPWQLDHWQNFTLKLRWQKKERTKNLARLKVQMWLEFHSRGTGEIESFFNLNNRKTWNAAAAKPCKTCETCELETWLTDSDFCCICKMRNNAKLSSCQTL